MVLSGNPYEASSLSLRSIMAVTEVEGSFAKFMLKPLVVVMDKFVEHPDTEATSARSNTPRSVARSFNA